MAQNLSEAVDLFRRLAREICLLSSRQWNPDIVPDLKRGTGRFELGRFHLLLDDRLIELAVDVPVDLWNCFQGR